MELFGSIGFFGTALAGGLGILLYRAVGVRWRIEYRHVIGCLCLALWFGLFWGHFYQPIGLAALAGVTFWLVRHNKIPRWLAVILTMVPLIVVKASISKLPAMLGLSFATFRAIDVLLFAQKNERVRPLDYLAYVFMPLTLLAGPMYRWRGFQADLKRGYDGISVNTWLAGLELVMLGVIQKFGLAEVVWRFGLSRVDAYDYSFFGVAANSILYSFYLFFDFAGYTSMAIGVGMLFGLNLPINFRNPLATLNPQDFWRRWHISLSEWLRDVVFMPIYKNLLSKSPFFGRHRLAAQNIGIFATLLAMGVWNGLSWHYVVSGVMFGFYSVGHNVLINSARTRPRLQAVMDRPPVKILGRIATLVLVVLALYVFSGRSPI
jgi:membrane protein involved in D-alanine export